MLSQPAMQFNKHIKYYMLMNTYFGITRLALYLHIYHEIKVFNYWQLQSGKIVLMKEGILFMKKSMIVLFSVFLFLAVSILPAQAGKIVLTNDEWTLSDTGFGQSGTQPGQFALNVANWFTGSAGNFLVYSNNFGLAGGSLNTVMTGAGYGWTYASPAPNPSLAYLQSFDAVFLAGNNVNNTTLIDYVNGGGNVFLEGGTASIDDANAWTTFLNAFGLAYGPNYNGITGNLAINSTHAIFANVSSLYQNNGNDTLDITASDPRSQVLIDYNGHGLYAVYDSGSSAVPEPMTLLLLGLGLIGVAGARKKFKK
jgi:hypothetical protein